MGVAITTLPRKIAIYQLFLTRPGIDAHSGLTRWVWNGAAQRNTEFRKHIGAEDVRPTPRRWKRAP